MADHASGLTLEQAMAGLPPDFAFFADRFRTQIQPSLAAKESERVAAVKRQFQFSMIAVVVFCVLAAAGFFLFNRPFGLIVGGIVAWGLYQWGSGPLNRLGKQTKVMLVDPVASQFGMTFECDPAAPSDILKFRDLGLVPHWDRSSFEDKLTGQRANAPFEFYEAHLEQKHEENDSRGNSSTKWVTVFRGQCLVARFPKPFNGVTKVMRDQGGMGNWFAKLGQSMPKVRLEDPVFEKAFEVYGTDQVEARFILTPDFMERLLKLEQTFEGKKVRCAFEGGEMYLCVEGKNLFEVGSMQRPMDDLGRVQEMLHDFAALFLLIDAMVERRTPEALRS